MDTFPITAQFSLSSWWPVATCLRTYPLAIHARSPTPSKPPAIMYQWGSHRVGAQLSCLTQPALCQRLGSRPLGCSAQFGSPGGTLAPGERDRTEIKKVVVTHTILFYGVAVPGECCLRQPASQKFPCPFTLTVALPLTPGRGLKDGRLLSCQPSVLVCWDAVLTQLGVSPEGVGTVPVRVGSAYLPCP